MLRIAICDDDVGFVCYIKKVLEEAGAKAEETEYYEYNSGKELIEAFHKDIEYSLLILDIQMPGMNGIDVAFEFRKRHKNTVLVFCSGVCKPTPTSFKVYPFRYLLKEYDRETMVRELSEVVQYLYKKNNAPIIEAHYHKNAIKLKPDDILYISIAKRGSQIHTYLKQDCFKNDGCFMCNKKVEELYRELEKEGFAYAHNSYIVNLKYIKIRNREEIELPNGEVLSVSRSKQSEFRSKLAAYLEEK